MTFDEMIAGEIRNTIDERYSKYCTPAKTHHFSLSYKIKKRRTIRSFEKGCRYNNRFSVRRVKYLVIAVVLAILLLVGFSLWLTISRFSFNIHQDHSEVYISRSESDKTSIEEIYELPDMLGYQVTYYSFSEFNVTTAYCYGDEVIRLGQHLIGDKYYVNTEYGLPEEVEINGNKGYIVKTKDDFLMEWTADGYLFSIDGNIDKAKAIELAKSTKIKNIVENP